MTGSLENMMVLVVDDNPDNVELVEQVLSDFYKTISADNGADCIELAKIKQPDLILLDVMMPEMDGYAVLNQLLADEKTKNIPVIFLTARYKDTDRIAKGLQLGAFDYITKPFDDDVLLARVAVALRVKFAEDLMRSQKVLLESKVVELSHAKQIIQQANIDLEIKNKELESFSYSVSHDLRAPLRSITGFSQVLLEDYESMLDDDAQGYLRRIIKGAHHMDSLISDLLRLAYTTRVEMKFESVNLSQLVNETEQRLRENSPDREIQFTVDEDVIVSADVSLMRSVIENLLDNAWKYTSRSPNSCIKFGVQVEDGRAVYFVKDNGVGFNPQYSDKLFMAFQRLHSSSDFPGTGIGLATVQRIIHRHGGQVWGEAELDKGATFYFTLPGKEVT